MVTWLIHHAVAVFLWNPIMWLSVWGAMAAVGHLAKAGKKAGVTLIGLGIVLAAIGWLWKRRSDVGRGAVVCVVGGCVLAWIVGVVFLPGTRWWLILPVTGVALVAVGFPEWGWLDQHVGGRSLIQVINDLIEGNFNRQAIASSADVTVGKPKPIPNGWEFHTHVNGDPEATLDPNVIGGRVNRGRSTARDVTVIPNAELGTATVRISADTPPVELGPWEMLTNMGPIKWPGPSSLDPDARVVLGFDVHGQPMSVSGPAPDGLEHVGVAGATRRGKSNTLTIAVSEYAFRPHTALILIDPARVEFKPWESRASRVFYGVDGSRAGVEAVYELMQRRAERVAALNRRTAPLGPGWPRIIVMSDEIAAYARNKDKEGRAAGAFLTMISEQGAKYGIQLWLATQRPEVGVWEGSLRDNLLARVGHRHTSGEGSRMTTGPGGPDLTSIPKSLRGAYFMFADDDWIPGRSLMLTPRGPVPADEKSESLAYAAAEVAVATAHLRIPWEQL